MYKFLMLAVSLVGIHTIHLYSVTLGVSCLNDESLKRKVILLYDKHETDPSDIVAQTKQHQDELIKLITAVSKRADESSFYIEFPYRTTHFKGTYDYSTIHIPIKDAFAHAMRHGSIEYHPFDERSESDYWVREMLINIEAVDDALKKGHPLPEEFKAVTIGLYLKTLQEHENAAQEIAKQLPLAVQEEAFKQIAAYQKIQAIITQEATSHALENHEHFFSLIKKSFLVASARKKAFFNFLSEAQTAYSDISLLHSVITNKKLLSIIHAEAYHVEHLEKALTLLGFRNAFPDRDLKNGLNVKDLHTIIWPTSIPASFIAPLYEFLSLCHTCGKQTTIQCGACKKTYYCTRECQKNNWSSHKLLCKKP